MKKIILTIGFFSILHSLFGIIPDTVYRITPQMYALIYKEFKVITKDNYSINAWFFPVQEKFPQDSIEYYYHTNLTRQYEVVAFNAPTIIVCNGDASNMGSLIQHAFYLSTNGFNVVTFDWRGFGESQKFEFDTNIVCEEFIFDYDAIIDKIVDFPEVNAQRIGAFGFSTGAYISFLQSARRNEIKALAVRAMFTSYREGTQNLFEIGLGRSHPYPSIFDTPEFMASYIAEKFTKPIFLIVGENDKRTPPEMAKQLLTLVNSKVKNLWIVSDAGHGSNEAPEVIASKQFKERLISFFTLNLNY